MSPEQQKAAVQSDKEAHEARLLEEARQRHEQRVALAQRTGAAVQAIRAMEAHRRLREDELAGSPFSPDPRDPGSVRRRQEAEARVEASLPNSPFLIRTMEEHRRREAGADEVSRWQEYDCPSTGIDVDRSEEALIAPGALFYCGACREHHVATPALVTEYEQRGDDVSVVPLGSWGLSAPVEAAKQPFRPHVEADVA